MKALTKKLKFKDFEFWGRIRLTESIIIIPTIVIIPRTLSVTRYYRLEFSFQWLWFGAGFAILWD